MGESNVDAVRSRILAEARKLYPAQEPAEWTRENLGDDWHVYNMVAKQMEEEGLVSLLGTSSTSLRVLLKRSGEEYCRKEAG